MPFDVCILKEGRALKLLKGGTEGQRVFENCSSTFYSIIPVICAAAIEQCEENTEDRGGHEN